MANLPLCSRVLMAPRFVYPIKDLERGMIEVRAPLPDTWVAQALGDTEVEATPGKTGELDVSLSLIGHDVLVRGKVTAFMTLPCARCLQNTDIMVQGDLALSLVPGKAPASIASGGLGGPSGEGKGKGKKGKRRPKEGDDGHVIDPSEAELDTYVGDEVVLDPFLREAILLEVPIFPLCSEACPGIGAASPQDTGTMSDDDAIDPRLAPLLELKKKSKV